MFSFSNPAVFDSGYSVGFSGNIFRRAREDYDELRQGAKLSVGKTVLRKTVIGGLRLGLTPNFEVIDIQNVDRNAPLAVHELQGSSAKLSVELSARMDRRDSRMFPTKGFQFSSSLQFSGLDVDIIKFTARGKKYFTIFNFPDWKGKHVLTLGGRVGIVESTSDQGVPIFERFYAGGSNSIRGFSFRGVGPYDPVANEHVGGKVLLLATTEYSMPVYGDMLRGAFFVDAGKADKDVNDINLSNFRATIGFGFRAKVPFMGNSVVSVDFGFPFINKDNDDEQTVTFNFGGR